MGHDANEPLIPPIGDAPGPARPLAANQAEALARAAVRRARATRSRPTANLQLVAGVALSLIVAGGAFAAVTGYLMRRPLDTGSTSGGRPQQGVRDRVKPSSPASESATVEAADTTADTTADTSGEPPPSPPAAASAAPEEPAAPAPTRPLRGHADLLRQANRLRAAGEYGRAERLYARVARGTKIAGAGETDAYAAAIAAAELRLEHTGNPRGALSLFRRALKMRPDGALSAAARHGIAQSLRSLGRPHAEARALRELIKAHPDHLLRKRAEARLQVLARMHDQGTRQSRD